MRQCALHPVVQLQRALAHGLQERHAGHGLHRLDVIAAVGADGATHQALGRGAGLSGALVQRHRARAGELGQRKREALVQRVDVAVVGELRHRIEQPLVPQRAERVRTRRGIVRCRLVGEGRGAACGHGGAHAAVAAHAASRAAPDGSARHWTRSSAITAACAGT